MNRRDELIFWFDQPPKVSLGAFNHVSQHWGNKVMYIADHGFGEHRKMINWNNSDYGDAELVILSDYPNKDEYIKEIFKKYPNAVHIMNGFFSDIEKQLRPYIQNENVKLVVHTERPFVAKRGFSAKQTIKNALLPIKYKICCKKYHSKVDALVVLGKLGKELFESYGWKKDKVYSFMYCPVLQEIDENNETAYPDKVSLLYVGRFNYATRGIDVLMEACKDISNTDWHLDMVGGYGDEADEIIEWANNHSNVSFLGTWPSDDVGKNMQKYDVYILATRADGWNAQLNEALNAGLGVICTDEAVSDEMVTASGAGIVVRAADAKALHEALETTVNNPELVKEWKEKAKAYRHRIKGDMVGDYLIDILDYTFYGKKEKPSCPWL